jgi:hypothetical protein
MPDADRAFGSGSDSSVFLDAPVSQFNEDGIVELPYGTRRDGLDRVDQRHGRRPRGLDIPSEGKGGGS